MRKRILTLAIALAMLTALVPTVAPVAFASDTVTERYLTDADRQIIANADARREAILNSPTTVT
ncbi:MAG: hypothetical protein LBI19_05040, partial [Oscillospiraceae bacterium]|nr:hypothetical protein [Oscillospiraceae bacterium]